MPPPFRKTRDLNDAGTYGAEHDIFRPAACQNPLGANGSIVLPATLSEALGLKEGGVLLARVQDGEIHLLTRMAVTRRAQALVRQFVPEGVSLVDELIEDRRREVEAERDDG